MINLEPYSAYKLYLALRLHFTTEKYDITKTRGFIKVSREAFNKRHDKAVIHRLSSKYSEDDLADYFIANFIGGDKWGGLYTSKSEGAEIYMNWKKRRESMSYSYKQDLLTILEATDGVLDNSWKCAKNEHPTILRLYLGQKIHIETLVVLNKLYAVKAALDQDLGADIIWADVSTLIKKYAPFVRFSKKAYLAATEKVVSSL